MTDVLPLLLLVASFVAGLLLIPFSLPGLWVMVLGVVGYGWLTDFRSVAVGIIGTAVGLALIGEIVEAWVGFHFARRYGASSRAGWGALVGGLVGAAGGLPIPLLGSVLGGFAGAFVGAALFELSRAPNAGTALGAGWGAVLGRAAAAAAKIALGIVIAVVTLYAALAG